jgi:DNA-binding IclR family transcriptional regulator
MSHRNLYLRFVGLANALQKGASAEMDPIALRLLEAITAAHEAGSLLRVSDALELADLASHATLHKKLDMLKAQGFVEIEYINDDRRTKYLAPSQLALTYFDELGKALMKASQSKLKS